MSRRVAVLTLVVLLTAQASILAQEPDKNRIRDILPRFEAQVKDGMARTGVPGVAVAIVYRGEVVFVKGFGICRVGDDTKVDADTLFQAASVSKPMTTTLLAALVSDGKIRWDDKVADLDPAFRLSDPWVSRALTLRDLLCHRSGLPEYAGDLLEDVGYDRRAILRRLRYLKGGGDFRAHYAYTNFGFTAAAESAALSVGTPWEDLLAQRLFRPLGMNATSARFADFEKVKNRAALHVPVDGEMMPKFIRNPDAQSPAGGVTTSARDIARWLQLHLAGGKWDGKPLIAADALHETYRPHMVTSFNPANFTHVGLYALGWNVRRDDDGRTYLNHSGAFTIGGRTLVALEHKEQAGIAVFVNAFPSGMPEGLADAFFDLLHHGKPTKDWLETEKQVRGFMAKMKETPRDYSKPPKQVTPSLPLTSYTGTYRNDFFGDLQVSERDGKLHFTIGPKHREFALKHWNRDVFVTTMADESYEGAGAVIFRVDSDGKAAEVTVEPFQAGGDGTFRRVR